MPDNTDFDYQAYRALISAILTLAVEDLKLETTSPHYQSAHRFFFGDWSEQCDKYLIALDMEPARFRAALREKMVDKLAA
jgi:hypothetical protein